MDKPALNTMTLRPFAHDGRAYKAYGFVIFAGIGSLLAVPQALIADLSNTVDGCPVPYEEVLAITNRLIGFTLEFPVLTHVSPVVSRMGMIAGDGWQHRPLSLFGCGRGIGLSNMGCPAVWLFAHPSGVRYAVTYDQLFPAR